MTRRSRITLLADDGLGEAEVVDTGVSVQDRRVPGFFLTLSKDFLSDIVDALIEVTGDNTYKILENQLAAETERRMAAEATVRALEGQLAAMRALLEPKRPAKFSDSED